MTDSDNPRGKPDPRFAAHMEAVGRVASEWNQLELTINYYIWELANVDQHSGACITAQIIPPLAKMRALISLVRLRGGSDAFIKKLNTFCGRLDRLARRRNRYIHDPWMIRNHDEEMMRLEISADRKLEFEFKPEKVEDLYHFLDEITDAIDRVEVLRDEAGRDIPPFDRTRFLQSQGVFRRRHQRDQASAPLAPASQPQPSEESPRQEDDPMPHEIAHGVPAWRLGLSRNGSVLLSFHHAETAEDYAAGKGQWSHFAMSPAHANELADDLRQTAAKSRQTPGGSA